MVYAMVVLATALLPSQDSRLFLGADIAVIGPRWFGKEDCLRRTGLEVVCLMDYGEVDSEVREVMYGF